MTTDDIGRHGIRNSGWPWFDRWRDDYIDEHGYGPETVELSAAEERMGHFATHWIRKLPKTAVNALREMWPDGVWATSAPGAQVSEAVGSVYHWTAGAGNRLLYAPSGRGKTMALTYCGLRAMSDPHWPEAAEYLTCDLVELDRWEPTDSMLRAPVLLLDELEKLVKIKPWKRVTVYALLNDRTRNGLETLSATNMPVDDLRGELGDEWLDRLAVGEQILEIRDHRNWRHGR
jgi:hypothetical protein